VQWSKTYASSYAEAYALAVIGDSVVAAGRIYEYSQYDGYLVRAAQADGALLWEQKAAFSAYYGDALYGVVAAQGGLLALGLAYVGGGAADDAWALLLNDKGALACACTGATCDDGNACTADACYLGSCKGKQVAAGTTCKDATVAAGKCDAAGNCISLCGNKTCDSGENNLNCPADCTTYCGNGVCEVSENFSNCSKDCKHWCDTHCGAKAPSGCYCDSTCKGSGYGDCCLPDGGLPSTKNYACTGSTCAACK